MNPENGQRGISCHGFLTHPPEALQSYHSAHARLARLRRDKSTEDGK